MLAAISSQGVHAPLVVIAEKGEERRAIQAFRLGAVDAILWPARDAEIVRVVERSLQPTRSRRIRRQLYQQTEAAQEELGRSQRELDSILSLVRAFGPGADPRTLLQRLPGAARELAEADVAWLTVRDPDTHDYVLRAQANLPTAWAKKLDQTLDDGLSSLVVRSGRALTIHGQSLEKSKVIALGRSAAVLPAKVRNEVVAMLIVVRKADQEFSAYTQKLLQGLADVAAAALLQARLLRALQDASAEARRDARSRARLLQSVESALQHLQRIQTGEAGELTKVQKETLAAMRISIEHVMRPEVREESGAVSR